MKLLVVLLSLVALCAGSAIPLVPGDNSHYVEGKSRYIWMPDGDGVPHLVDLHTPVPESAADPRNGANNAYWLFTRRNPSNAQIIRHGDVNSLRNSNYAPARPLVVVVHGWNSNGNSAVNPLVRNAYLAVQDVNVIVVDWSRHANGLYNAAVWAVPSVGQYLGNFINWIFSNVGGNWNNVHLIGFSLGAHIVGNAGRQVGGRPARVTGLDPAGPQWGGNSLALNNRAGQYVEAIHTDGGILGINDRIAHADFYPNGGNNPQPGCSSVPLVGSPCSHSRAYELFAATVRYNHLVGRLCSNQQQANNQQCSGSTLNMGNGIFTKRGNGIYGLVTRANYPY